MLVNMGTSVHDHIANEGIPQNFVTALYWTNLSAWSGYVEHRVVEQLEADVDVFLSIETGYSDVTFDQIVRCSALLMSTPFSSVLEDGALRID